MRLKLIFNPKAGNPEESPAQLLEIITQLQQRNFEPEPYVLEPGGQISTIIQDALKREVKLFVVCGGDGTIEDAAEALVETEATLGIIPTGTRNNVALSLGIPKEISAAVELLQFGDQIKLDLGQATCGKKSRFFLETCSIGLLSALFPAADDIQHGNITRIGDFLNTLFNSPSAEMHLQMDLQQEIHIRSHVILITNLPYFGPNFQVASKNSIHDGLLDLFVFPELTKLDLFNQVIMDGFEGSGIERYQVQEVKIITYPSMPVMADGFSLGEGSVSIHVKKGALSVITGNQIHKYSQEQQV